MESSSSWENLPTDVLLHMMAMLPLRALMRLRCVCRQWQSFISRPDVLAVSRPSKSPLLAEPMLGVSFEGAQSLEWVTYSFDTKRWTSMAPFPEQVQTAFAAGERMEFFSAGGLLFFLTSSYGHYTTTRCLVFNPLTRVSRELPLFSRDWMCGAFAHPIVDTQADSYKLMMGDQENWARYDAASDSWEEGCIHATGCLASGTKGVRCNDLLFFVVPTMRGKSDLATYNSQENVWLNTFDYDQMAEVGYHLNNRGVSENNRIFEWDGALFLMTKPDGCFWELDLVTKSWTLRFDMPRALMAEFEKVQDCIASGDRLCVVGSAKIPRYTSLWVVHWKRQGLWERLPACPYHKSDAQTFLFQPSLLSV